MVNVPVVILAGGRGARFDHETEVLPKPLIEVAGRPILGHIMDLCEAQGFDDFIILGGYMWGKIDAFLASRYGCRSQAESDFILYGRKGEPVKARLLDTGEDTTTGGRVLKAHNHLLMRWVDPFILTYGDGLCDVNLMTLLEFHSGDLPRGGRRITVTAVRPPGRFGVIELSGSTVTRFGEKPRDGWINGGFIVTSSWSLNDYFEEVEEHSAVPVPSFEEGAMTWMADRGLMRAYTHEGYWRCMDTRRDREQIEADVVAAGGRLPWRRDMMEGR